MNAFCVASENKVICRARLFVQTSVFSMNVPLRCAGVIPLLCAGVKLCCFFPNPCVVNMKSCVKVFLSALNTFSFIHAIGYMLRKRCDVRNAGQLAIQTNLETPRIRWTNDQNIHPWINLIGCIHKNSLWLHYKWSYMCISGLTYSAISCTNNQRFGFGRFNETKFKMTLHIKQALTLRRLAFKHGTYYGRDNQHWFEQVDLMFYSQSTTRVVSGRNNVFLPQVKILIHHHN